MDPETSSKKNYDIHCDPSDPNTAVVLKTIQHMSQLLSITAASQSNKTTNIFPNYFILNNLKVSHLQRMALHAMLRQPTSPPIMINQFCLLAKQCYVGQEQRIEELEEDSLKSGGLQVAEVLKWYTKQTFFYRLLNRILRAGKVSTQLFYAQHFVKNLSEAITQVHRKQRQRGQKQVRGRFKCYRGGYFSEEQIKELKQNVGKHIETLGFLSTTIDKEWAQVFITNTLLEIEVSDQAKDEELDLGYAYLTAEYSTKPDEKEVLFNVLSSFKIKSVTKEISVSCQLQYWHVKLEYGVAYEMAHKYKQSKMCLQRESPEYEQLLSILEQRNAYEPYSFQDLCLIHENLDEQAQLANKRVEITQNIFHQPDLARKLKQIFEQNIAAVKKANLPRSKSKFKPQFNQKNKFEQLHQKLCELNLNPWLNTFEERLNILMKMCQEICEDFSYQRFSMCLEAAEKWEKQKQFLKAEMMVVAKDPRWSPQPIMQYMQTCVKAFKCISKMNIYCQSNLSNKSNNNQQKLREQYKNMQLLKQQALARFGKYNIIYAVISGYQIKFMDFIGLSYEEYLDRRLEVVIFLKGTEEGQVLNFEIQRITNARNMYQLMKKRKWVEAIQGCAAFRDKYYKDKQDKDLICFDPIFAYWNNQQLADSQKLQIVLICFSINHPHNSQFYKFMIDGINFGKQLINLQSARPGFENQYQLWSEKSYIQDLIGVHEFPASEITACLQCFKQNISEDFGEDTAIWVVNQCLIVNSLRMMGRYEEAALYLYQLKKKIGPILYSYYDQMFNLSRFEERPIESGMMSLLQ